MVITDTVTRSADDTRMIGKDLARYLDIGKVVAFYGDLGIEWGLVFPAPQSS